MGGHVPTSREIDAKVLALRAAIAQDQIRQQRKTSANNTTVGNPHQHAGLIPSHHFVQRIDPSHQRQQVQPYFTGQAEYSPLNGQNIYHQHLNTQPSPQSLEGSPTTEDIFSSLMNIDQLNQILENGNKVINMSTHVLPLIDQQSSAQLFGMGNGNGQDFVPSPNHQAPKPRPLIKAPSHKRSVSAISTSYHPTLMEEMDHPNTNSFLTPPGTPMYHGGNSPIQGKLPLPRLQVSPKQVQNIKEGGSNSGGIRREGHLTYHPIAPHPNGSEMGVMRAAPPIVATCTKIRRKSSSAIRNQRIKQCSNCGDINTSQWRHDREKQILCNPCGLYLRNHGLHRDVSKILAKKGEFTLTELCRRTRDAALIGGDQAKMDLERELLKTEVAELVDMVQTLEACLKIARRCLDTKSKEIEKEFTN